MAQHHGSSSRWLPVFVILAIFLRLLQSPELASADILLTTCTNAALQTALNAGGTITFNCGVTAISITDVLIVNTTATIDGGDTITLDGGGANRILKVGGAGVLTLKNLTVKGARFPGGFGAGVQVDTGGMLTVENATFRDNDAIGGGTGAGGAIYAAAGTTLTVQSGRFISNTADYGGAILADGVQSISNATFLTNTATVNGGAYGTNGNATFSGSTFVNNRANGVGSPLAGGGAIRAVGALTMTTNSVVDRNYAESYGGGIYATTLNITSSTVVSNTAVGNGGGIVAGTAMISGTSVMSNTAGSSGGGFFTSLGTVIVENSVVNGNRAASGGGMYLTDDGTSTVARTTISGNTSTANAGGILHNGTYPHNSSLILQDVVLSDNATGGTAGGIFNINGGLTISQSSIRNNTAAYGGGIHNFFGREVKIRMSTLSGNVARGGGEGSGGGLFNELGDAILENVTMSGNTAEWQGGGLANLEGSRTSLLNVTMSENSALTGGGLHNASGSITLTNSIVANSLKGGNCSGGVTSSKNNIASDSTCVLANSLNNTDPKLTVLGNYGGPTQVHVPLAGSPAIDGVVGNDAPVFDQRGVARPLGAGYDIGAVEVGFKPILNSLSQTSTPAASPSLVLTVNGSNFHSGTEVLWNAAVRPTTYISSTRLLVNVPGSDFLAGGTAAVSARNAPIPEETSNALPFTISKLTQTVSFAPLPNRRVTDGPFLISATASSGLPVTFSANGNCTMAGTTVTLNSAGVCTIRASQPGDATYAAAPDAEQSFTVTALNVFLSAVLVSRAE